jgi:hypothetical protein
MIEGEPPYHQLKSLRECRTFKKDMLIKFNCFLGSLFNCNKWQTELVGREKTLTFILRSFDQCLKVDVIKCNSITTLSICFNYFIPTFSFFLSFLPSIFKKLPNHC